MIRVILCDDHAFTRRGVRDTLSDASDISIVGEAGDYSELRALMRQQPCDVLVLDINLPGRSGLEVLQALKDEGSSVRVVVLSMNPADQYAIRAIRGGAMGYVDKNDPHIDTLVNAVRAVAGGRKHIPPEVMDLILEGLANPRPEVAHEALSNREMQVLRMLASAKRPVDIADALKISPKTVAVYRVRLLEKLRLKTTPELTLYAIKHQLVES